MNKGIIISEIEKIKDNLSNDIKSESLAINSISEEFSNLNSCVSESHKDDFISIQNNLLKVSSNFKKNHDSEKTIIKKNIEKYSNVVLENQKLFQNH